MSSEFPNNVEGRLDVLASIINQVKMVVKIEMSSRDMYDPAICSQPLNPGFFDFQPYEEHRALIYFIYLRKAFSSL